LAISYNILSRHSKLFVNPDEKSLQIRNHKYKEFPGQVCYLCLEETYFHLIHTKKSHVNKLNKYDLMGILVSLLPDLGSVHTTKIGR
jgi:hypothetical protein